MLLTNLSNGLIWYLDTVFNQSQNRPKAHFSSLAPITLSANSSSISPGWFVSANASCLRVRAPQEGDHPSVTSVAVAGP